MKGRTSLYGFGSILEIGLMGGVCPKKVEYPFLSFTFIYEDKEDDSMILILRLILGH